jgi:hypothetical protein
MIKETKVPREWKTWSDFADNYNLVMFNNCTELVPKDSTSYFEGVTLEWLESHDCSKEEEDEECFCEPYQWYAIACSDSDKEYLNEYFALDIFWSEILQLHILPVYHYGTAWTHVSLEAVKSFD